MRCDAAIRVQLGAVCIETTKSTACEITLWFREVVYWKSVSRLAVGVASTGEDWWYDSAAGDCNKMPAIVMLDGLMLMIEPSIE